MTVCWAAVSPLGWNAKTLPPASRTTLMLGSLSISPAFSAARTWALVPPYAWAAYSWGRRQIALQHRAGQAGRLLGRTPVVVQQLLGGRSLVDTSSRPRRPPAPPPEQDTDVGELLGTGHAYLSARRRQS
jgi:hypothetical protein